MQFESNAVPQDIGDRTPGPQLVDVDVTERPPNLLDWESDLDDEQRALSMEAIEEAGAEVDPAQFVNLARRLDELASPPVP